MTYDFGGGSWTRSSNRNRLALVRLMLAWLVFCLALGSVSTVQAQSEAHSGRKVIRSERPEYPATLKNAGIGGLVRLSVKVLANGTVADVEVLGGNPILAESAVKTAKKWRYVPAASSSNEVIMFDFKGR